MKGILLKPFLDHFSLLAPFYEFFIRPKNPEKICSLAHLPACGIILDAGGGTGRVAQYLRNNAALILVADESLKMLHEAQKKMGCSQFCLIPRICLSRMIPLTVSSWWMLCIMWRTN